MIIIIQKVNSNFQKNQNTKQVNGLSVCINMLSDLIYAKVINVVDHLGIYKAVAELKPKALIFQAMSFNYLTLLELKRSYPDLKIYVHIHSKFPFLGNEPNAITYIQKVLANGIEVIFNHRSALQMFPSNLSHYLPNYYSAESPVVKKELKPGELHVGCHGSLRTLKNQVVQASAACRLAKDLNKKLYFHINGTRNDGERDALYSSIDKIISMSGGSLVTTPWLDHSQFLNYIATLDIGFQVSLCETFNIVAADYVTAGIPLVVSNEIEWAGRESMAMATDISEIVSTAKRALEIPSLIEDNKNCLRDHNIKAASDWLEFKNSIGD